MVLKQIQVDIYTCVFKMLKGLNCTFAALGKVLLLAPVVVEWQLKTQLKHGALLLKAETFSIFNAHRIESRKHVKLPVLSGTCNSASSALKIMRERTGAVKRDSRWTRNLRLYAVSLHQAMFG